MKLFWATTANVLGLAFFCAVFVGQAGDSYAKTLVADPKANPSKPNYYRNLVGQLRPGDVLQLPAGIYPERLNLSGIQGRPNAWITITGPESGSPAVVTTSSTCCNNVQLGNTWYVAIKNLTIDSASLDGIDGINAKDGVTHDILIENCMLKGQGSHQATIGISTKSTAWNWIIRRNQIIQAGTGLYLGSSDGSAPFVAGVIENNLIVDTIGYNMEIKFQRPYAHVSGMPSGPNRTIIRNNVFIKKRAQADWPPMPDGTSRLSGPRPNLLVGGFPNTGLGSEDLYDIYGNLFYRNPDEALLQASGRVAIHDNIFVGASDAAIRLQHHDLPLKLAYVYSNTIYGGPVGIALNTTATHADAIVGNLIFAEIPIGGTPRNFHDNIVDTAAHAGNYLKNPSLTLGAMDFYPLPGKCQGSPLDFSLFSASTEDTYDFNGNSKGNNTFRGAYAGDGTNPGWALSEGIKAIKARFDLRGQTLRVQAVIHTGLFDDEERFEFEARVIGPKARGVVIPAYIHDPLLARDNFQGSVVIFPVPQNHQLAVDSLKDQVECQITESHGRDRIDRIRMAAAHQVAQALADHINSPAVVKFCRPLLQLI